MKIDAATPNEYQRNIYQLNTPDVYLYL